jgi:hypothetical protein
MQVILTASDLTAMPAALREELLAYLATRRKTAALSGARRRHATADNGMFDGLAVLDRDQATALIRNVSFGRKLRGLHDLLEALSYEKDGDAPGREQLARLLTLDDARHLRRYFNAIERCVKPFTHDTAPILRYSRRTGSYLVHPTTRASLREVFAQLARSGEGEEPLWA